MAELGGSSTISGVGYEQWVFAHFMVHDLLSQDRNNIITPQKVREISPTDSSQTRKIEIDDLVIINGTKTTHYSIKQHATLGVWNVSQLKASGIITAFKKQYELTPDRDLFLISQSDSPIIRELIRLRGCSSRPEINGALSKDLLAQWDALKEEFGYDDDRMLEVSKKLNISVIDENSIRNNIDAVFRAKFNVKSHESDTLFTYAFDRSISKLPTSREDIVKYLSESGIVEKSTLSDEVILSSIKNSTANLETSVSPFQFEHINRTITSEVIGWITKERNWKDAKTSKILTLAGKAGMGKTTVLQDLLKELQRIEIPVLALKADVVSFSNSEDLKQVLELPDTVDRILAYLSQNKSVSVLLIDQIDALSLTLSTDRAQINRYKELISRCQKLPNVLIVLSCRTYDLNNDLDLNQYSTNQTMEVGSLSVEEMTTVLDHSGINVALLSKETLELLSTPLHLSIYVYLSKSNTSEGVNYTTLNELYDELHKRVILTSPNRQKLQELVENTSSLMYEKQTLRVSRTLLDSDYFTEINYLLSSGILQEKRNEISFFHQTFLIIR